MLEIGQQRNSLSLKQQYQRKRQLCSKIKSTQLTMINLTPSALPDLPLTSLRTAEEKRADNVFMGKSTVIGKK